MIMESLGFIFRKIMNDGTQRTSFIRYYEVKLGIALEWEWL